MRRTVGPWGDGTAHLRRRAVVATRGALAFGFSAVVLGLFDVFGPAMGLMALSVGCGSVILLAFDEIRRPDAPPPPATWLDGVAVAGVLGHLWLVFAP